MRANIWHLGAIRETRWDWVSGNGVDGHDRYDLGDGRWMKVELREFACKREGCSARTGEPVRTDWGDVESTGSLIYRSVYAESVCLFIIQVCVRCVGLYPGSLSAKSRTTSSSVSTVVVPGLLLHSMSIVGGCQAIKSRRRSQAHTQGPSEGHAADPSSKAKAPIGSSSCPTETINTTRTGCSNRHQCAEYESEGIRTPCSLQLVLKGLPNQTFLTFFDGIGISTRYSWPFLAVNTPVRIPIEPSEFRSD